MRDATVGPLEAPAYPIEPWRIREVAFDPAMAARNETVFSLGNGHLGIRGTLEEDAGNVTHGTYVNGFFEEAPIVYGETAHGYARHHQVLLDVADGTRIQLFVDDEPFDLASGRVELHERTLDLRAGSLARTVRWRSPAGHLVEVTTRRLVSLRRPDIAAIEFVVALLEGNASLRVESAIDARARSGGPSDDPRVGTPLPEGALATIEREASGTWGAVVQRTQVTRQRIVAAMDHRVSVDGPAAAALKVTSAVGEERVACQVGVDAAPGTRLQVTKLLAYATSLDGPEETLLARARGSIASAIDGGFAALLDEQRAELDRFWEGSDVEIDGDDALQQGVRFNLFSLFQAAGRDGRTSLAAKGLTGKGYDGHYFWDAEIFAQPFFVYTQPEIARALLRYRCGTLDKARARASEVSQRGALYPWRTIGGEEASAYFPAGTAQYHIDADIAYAFAKYVRATGDRTLLEEGGAEVVFETARLWADLGAYIPAWNGAFCLNAVTGPDEYTAIVDNDCYTNMMAREHLRYASDLAGRLAEEAPAFYEELALRLALTPDEVAEWRRAADLMRIPRDEALGIHAQDDTFLAREVWDFAGTPASLYPLLLHFHPLVIYRHQVLKQPDVVLAQVLLGQEFTLSEKKRNFDYYDPLTTGDSSLSPCIQSVAAAELGYGDLAHAYFMKTARMDLDDVNGNVSHGVHIAAMAGSWVSLVYGFAGFRDDGGRAAFAPRLPGAWDRLRFCMRIRGSRLQVTVRPHEVTYGLLAGDPLEIEHFGRPLRLVAGEPVTVSLEPRLQLVIFDLDGVITDTAEHHYRAWQRLAGEISVPFDRELNERLKGVSRMESLEIILENAGRSASLADRVRLADRKNAYFRELIANIGPDDLLPGMRELLTALRDRGVKRAIASMSHNAPDVIRGLGIGPLLDLVVDPATLVKGKPDPEIFLTAAEQLGIRPEDCVGIEDAPAGVEAIKAARMRAVGVGADLASADVAVTSTAEITAEMLESLVAGIGRAAARGPRRGR
jgi:beta-phosphoglucomutase